MLVAGLAFQAIAVPPVIHSQRDLGPEIEEAFQWIRHHTPPEARIQYLEENLTAATGRPIVWAALGPYVIFRIDEAEQMRILKYLDISYIAIHPTRRCDTCDPLRVPIAYPRPWIRTLEGRPYLERVYPKGDLPDTEGRFLLYRIDYDKVPREWLRPLEESPRVD